MKIKKLVEEIVIPDGVEVNIDDGISVKGEKGHVTRSFMIPLISINIENKKIILKALSKKLTKKDKRVIGTISSHIRNMIKGVVDGYEYRLKICSGHFPISVGVEGNKVVIKNFFGEKIPRKVEFSGVDVKVDGDIISVIGIDKEKVGNVAAKIEQITKIKGRDRRIFQDGCFIIKKD